jgi:hypothetical protein
VTQTQRIASAMDALGGAAMSPSNLATIEALLPKIGAMASARATTPEALIATAWSRFKSDDKTKGNRMVRHEVFLRQLDNWCDDAPKATAPVVAPARRLLNQPPETKP